MLLDEGWPLLHTRLADVAREVAAELPNAPLAEEAARMMFALVEGPDRVVRTPDGIAGGASPTQLDALFAAWR